MRFLFLGDVQFGRNGENTNIPDSLWNNLLPFLKDIDYLVFNLETVVSAKPLPCIENKDICLQSDSERYLRKLRRQFKGGILVSTVNNHTFDCGVEGYLSTLGAVYRAGMGTPYFKSSFTDDNTVFICATDHWTLFPKNQIRFRKILHLWKDNTFLIIDSNSERNFIQVVSDLISQNKKSGKKVIVSVHWGLNWEHSKKTSTYLNDHIQSFAHNLIDMGVWAFFGTGAHHILEQPYEIYNGHLVIYGMGDAYGDFQVSKKYQSADNMALAWDGSRVEEIDLVRDYVGSGKRPYGVLSVRV